MQTKTMVKYGHLIEVRSHVKLTYKPKFRAGTIRRTFG